MTIDLKPLLDFGKKALRCKDELERLEKYDKRLYEISRMLPEEEGYELINIHKQTIKDTTKIQRVIYEK